MTSTSLVLLHLRELGGVEHVSCVHEAMLGPNSETDARARAFRDHPVADVRQQQPTTAEDPLHLDGGS